MGKHLSWIDIQLIAMGVYFLEIGRNLYIFGRQVAKMFQTDGSTSGHSGGDFLAMGWADAGALF